MVSKERIVRWAKRRQSGNPSEHHNALRNHIRIILVRPDTQQRGAERHMIVDSLL